MDKQTQDYITLKPISDRFRQVADSITDDEIRFIIKDELRNQIRNQVDFGSVISVIVDNWFDDDDNYQFIIDELKKSIMDGLKR